MHVWVFFPPCSLSLDAASQVYLQSGSTTVWVLFSPARSYGQPDRIRKGGASAPRYSGVREGGGNSRQNAIIMLKCVLS